MVVVFSLLVRASIGKFQEGVLRPLFGCFKGLQRERVCHGFFFHVEKEMGDRILMVIAM
jgi:hypothetical protein